MAGQRPKHSARNHISEDTYVPWWLLLSLLVLPVHRTKTRRNALGEGRGHVGSKAFVWVSANNISRELPVMFAPVGVLTTFLTGPTARASHFGKEKHGI